MLHFSHDVSNPMQILSQNVTQPMRLCQYSTVSSPPHSRLRRPNPGPPTSSRQVVDPMPLQFSVQPRPLVTEHTATLAVLQSVNYSSKRSSSKFILNAKSLRTVHIRAHLKHSWCHLKSFYQATRRSSNCHEQSTPNNLRKEHDSPWVCFDDSFKVWSCSYDPWLILCRTRFKVHRDCLCLDLILNIKTGQDFKFLWTIHTQSSTEGPWITMCLSPRFLQGLQFSFTINDSLPD